MDKNREHLNWQPISFLSKIATMIDGMLDAANETYEPLRQIEVHDDFTIQRIFEEESVSSLFEDQAPIS